MPFLNFTSKLVLIIVSFLVHHALVARSASLGSVSVAEAPTNPNSSTGGVGNTSSEAPLLDATQLPFLASCNSNADVESVKLCELYRTLATTVLSQRGPEPATAEDVRKASDQKLDSDSFCDDLAPVVKNRKTKHPEFADNPLDNKIFCTVWCVKTTAKNTLGVKPICKVLLWAFRQELLAEQKTVPEDLAKQVAGAVVPPLLPENVNLPEAVKNQEPPIESKPVEPVPSQPDITDPKKTIQEPTVPKPNEAADTKEPPSDAAAVKAPSAAVVPEKSKATIGKGATTVASNVQQKPTDGLADEATVDEDDQQMDANDEQNENNINANNNDGKNDVNAGENTDEMYDEDEAAQQPVAAVPKESQVKEGQDRIDDDRDSDFSVEQPAAAAAVQIERVDPFFDQDDSNFFSYFMFMMFACIVCYVAYHNKSKLLALLVEGRRGNSGRGGFSKGRKHTAAYRKLDSNLEEAITSNASTSSRSTSQIIY